MIRRPPRSTLTYKLVPYTTRFRSAADVAEADPESLCAYRVEDPRIAGIGAADRVGDRDCRRAKLRCQPGLAFGHLGLQLPVRQLREHPVVHAVAADLHPGRVHFAQLGPGHRPAVDRSEEHTSELQSLMRISYAVFCLKKKTKTQT